jgi:hypothetical protein
MESVTHLYTYPGAIDGKRGRAEIDEALVKLSAELELPHELRIRGGHAGRITIPDVAPEEAWAAIDRAVPDWPQLFLPRPAG